MHEDSESVDADPNAVDIDQACLDSLNKRADILDEQPQADAQTIKYHLFTDIWFYVGNIEQELPIWNDPSNNQSFRVQVWLLKDLPAGQDEQIADKHVGLPVCYCFDCSGVVDSAPAITTEDMVVTYTPSYNTQYAVTVPLSFVLNANCSHTTVTFTIGSWSDFPSDKTLYCDLAASNDLLLTNGSDESAKGIGMIVKHGSTVIAAGDRIDTFTPASLNGSDSDDFVVLTVEPESKPFLGGTYSGTLSFSCGIEDK